MTSLFLETQFTRRNTSIWTTYQKICIIVVLLHHGQMYMKHLRRLF